MRRPQVGAEVFIKAGGSAVDGAPGLVIYRNHTTNMCGVELLDDRSPYSKGEVVEQPAGQLAEQLNADDRVAYAPAYLTANKANPREYARTGYVVKRMEGTLVQVDWDDKLGPQVVSTFQLEKVRP